MWNGVIPLNIRRNKAIPDKVKLLYAEITACLEDDMVCRKTNEELSSYMGVSPETVRRYLYDMHEMELIHVDVNGPKREITMPEKVVIIEDKRGKKKIEKREDLAKEVLSIWNEGMGCRRTMTKNLVKEVTDRTKAFEDSQIIEAVKNRMKLIASNPWYETEEGLPHRNRIDLVLRSDRDLSKHLNMDIPKDSGDSLTMFNMK